MIPSGMPQFDEFFTDQLLDFLEKLGIKSARPQNFDEALRRAVGAIDFAENSGINVDELLKRIRR